jgi:RNA polymerase sigma-70 factor (ECF subfamily)
MASFILVNIERFVSQPMYRLESCMREPGIFSLMGGTSYEEAENSAPAERVTALFDAYHTKIYRFLVGQGIDLSNAQELTQETFVRIFVALSKGDEIRSEQAWLFGVASKVAVDYWRRENRPMWVDLNSVSIREERFISSDPTPEAAAVEQQKLRRVAAAMASLPKEQRLSIHLRMQGCRYKEIAKVLGVSVTTVNTLLSSAVERLRSIANE